MDSIEVEEINFELRKINAIKIKNRKTTGSEDEKNTDEKNADENSFQSKLNVAIRQENDLNVIEVFLYYRIPSVMDFELEIDAEFYARVTLNETFDLETLSGEEEEEQFSDFSATFMPKLLKEIDKSLLPIFKSMNVKFTPLASKSN